MSTLQGHRTTDLESQTGGLVDTAAGSDTEMGETGGNGREGGSVFPLARIKKIMKADKDVSLCSAEAVHLVSLAAVPEMFIDLLVKRAIEASQSEKRRTILYKDFASVMKLDPRLEFLQELVPEMVSVQAALEAQKSNGMIGNTTPITSRSVTPQRSKDADLMDHFAAPSQSASTDRMSESRSSANVSMEMTDILNPSSVVVMEEEADHDPSGPVAYDNVSLDY